VAAGITAILAGVLAALSIALSFTALLTINTRVSDQYLPEYARLLSEIVWGTLLLVACFLVLSGVAVIRLRGWARISLLVIAVLMLFFGVIGIVVILFVVLGSDMPGPPGNKATLIGALTFVYGLPILVALWWLILFTRRSVVAQFQTRAAALPPPRKLQLAKPGCPLPVSIVAWFLLLSLLNLIILPFLPSSIPLLLFGHLLHGPLATALLLIQLCAIAAGGIGLLRLKRWSFPLTVALQLFYVANGLICFINPNYPAQMVAILGQLHLPINMPEAAYFLRYIRYFGWLGLLFPLACVVALLYAREAFYAAALASDRTAPTSLQS
jgi:hypothetical protein